MGLNNIGKDKKNWSIRTKLIAVLSMSVLCVSGVLLYVTTDMLYRDKRAYLFDNTFQALSTNKSIIDRFTLYKRRQAQWLSQLYQATGNITISNDPDLLSISSFSQISDNDSQIEENFDPSSFKELFLNSDILARYKFREDFIRLERKHFFKHATEIEKLDEKMVIVYEGGAPHLIVYRYIKEKKSILAFNFLLDNMFSEALSRNIYEAGLVTTNGDVILFSRPGRDLKSYRPVLRAHLKSVTLGFKKPSYLGVNEVRFKDDIALVGLTSITDLSNIFFFTSIRSGDAYQMTFVMIASTFFFGIFLIGFFALAAIFLARMLTIPLEKMALTIVEISQGNFSARLTKQNTTELERLAESFNRMLDIIQEYQKKLQYYNRSLEAKVQERTVDLQRSNAFIRSVLDSLSLGLVVINKAGQCLELHSKASVTIFQKSPPGNKLSELIDHRDETFLNQWLKGLFEEMIPFESLSELGPKIYHPESNPLAPQFRHIRLSYFPIRSETGEISSLILLATDSTQEYLDQLKLEDNRRFVQQVYKAIKNRQSFASFVSTTRSLLASEVNKLENDNADMDELKRNLHSLKGLSGFFCFERFASEIHGLEDKISQEKLDNHFLKNSLKKLIGLFDLEVDSLNDFIGNLSPHLIELDKRDLISFKVKLDQLSINLAQEFSEKFLLVPVSSLIKHYDQLIQELASKLNKEVAALEIEGEDIRVSAEKLKAFFESCVHLFRNAIDHGLEFPEERESLGKSRQGKISVIVLPSSQSMDHFYFEVQDDGRGIDANKIRRKIQSNGSSTLDHETDEEVIYHIFDADFSTTENVTDISGRGVGLHDVRHQATELGSDVKIATEVGQGTSFKFYLPRW